MAQEGKNIKIKVPQVAKFDHRPMDFFRGSRGFGKKSVGFRRDYTGIRRGSR